MAKTRKLNGRLKRAVFGNNIEEADKVLEEGADVNTRIEYMAERTCLIHACDKLYHRMFNILLVQGARVNDIDMWGDTALIHAASRSTEEHVDLLLQRNADVNWKGRVVSEQLFLYHVQVLSAVPVMSVRLSVCPSVCLPACLSVYPLIDRAVSFHPVTISSCN